MQKIPLFEKSLFAIITGLTTITAAESSYGINRDSPEGWIHRAQTQIENSAAQFRRSSMRTIAVASRYSEIEIVTTQVVTTTRDGDGVEDSGRVEHVRAQPRARLRDPVQ